MNTDLLRIKNIYDKINLTITDVIKEEGDNYNATAFKLTNKYNQIQYTVKFRTGKITDKKIGYFVTLWERYDTGIKPFSSDIDLVVISVKNNINRGHFVFPKIILLQKNIIGDKGKLGIRVYAPWNIVDNKKATQTQQWQLQYFIDTTHIINLSKVRALYNVHWLNSTSY
jgi:hypothetical protein